VPTRTGRRELLQAGVIGAAAIVVASAATAFGRLAGNGASGGGDVASGSPGATRTPGPGGATGVPSAGASPSAAARTPAPGGRVVANLARLPKDSAIAFTLPTSGDPGVIVRFRNGNVVAFDATCTHQGCPVDFDAGSGLLICPCHGATFDPAHGAAVLGGPTNQPLVPVRISVDQSSGDVRLTG
jgi:thiosulfate dehydrogenase [quinone] large subunit